MKVEKQKPTECVLATIAALSNTQLRSVRKFACKRAGIADWGEIINMTGDEFWRIVASVARHYKVTAMPKALRFDDKPISSNSGILQGRGSISLQIKSHLNCHTMPFEDGIVYDPEYPDKPLSLDALLDTRYIGWNVVDISR